MVSIHLIYFVCYTQSKLLQNPPPMIKELAILSVKAGQEADFEAAFSQAQAIISAMPGYLSHSLSRGIDTPNQYLLLVDWETLEDHTVGFRQSAPYQEWKRLLHHFYDPFPTVEHYDPIL